MDFFLNLKDFSPCGSIVRPFKLKFACNLVLIGGGLEPVSEEADFIQNTSHASFEGSLNLTSRSSVSILIHVVFVSQFG